jgi:hypothetical protein
MITLEINEKVFLALKAQFPKPANSARRALDKYRRVLEQQINDAVLMGREPLNLKLGIVTISLYKQRNGGGQIGPTKLRFQNWLEDNKLELFKVLELGTNYNKQLTTIKLSKLVTINEVAFVPAQLAQSAAQSINPTDSNSNSHTDPTAAQLTNKALFEKLFPEVETLNEAEIKERFDVVEVNQESLKHYYNWLQTGAKLIDQEQLRRYKDQAEHILKLADHASGFYFQRRKPSAYGRIYYEGISVQNINKEMRRAMLAPSWEHDVRSSVFTWKMTYAPFCYSLLETDKSLEQTFSATINFLQDKKEFMASVRYLTFLADSNVPRDLQDKLIKRATTAIGFGARATASGQMPKAGKMVPTTLGQIIYNLDELKRFLNCPLIKHFIREQKMLDAVIFYSDKVDTKAFFNGADVHTQGGRLSKAKVIAFMYQTYETQLMDAVQLWMEELGKTVIARIHDAIITREKLSVDDRHEIMLRMREATDNKYWHMNSKQLLPYQAPEPIPEPENAATKAKRERWLTMAMGKLFGRD